MRLTAIDEESLRYLSPVSWISERESCFNVLFTPVCSDCIVRFSVGLKQRVIVAWMSMFIIKGCKKHTWSIQLLEIQLTFQSVPCDSSSAGCENIEE